MTTTWCISRRTMVLRRERGELGPLEPGMHVDRYEVIELLGEGSMGSVYRVRDIDLAREVALKRINRTVNSLAKAQLQLQREVGAIAKVKHPAVVRRYRDHQRFCRRRGRDRREVSRVA